MGQELSQDVSEVNHSLEGALEAASFGFLLFPVCGPNRTEQPTWHECDDENRGKHPLLVGWQKKATSSESTIRKWAELYPRCNFGIATGREMFVLDVDGEAGRESLRALEDQHGELPKTAQTLTGGGGKHYYFCVSDGIQVRNDSKGIIAPKIHLRGIGGYVVCPGSLHKSGKRYEWASGLSPQHISIADAPDWLINLVTQRPSKDRLGATKKRDRNEHPILRGMIADGERNVDLFKFACYLRDRGIKQDMTLALLMPANKEYGKPPKNPDEVQKAVESAFKYPERPSRKPGPGQTASQIFRWLWMRCWSEGTNRTQVLQREIAAAFDITICMVRRHIKTLEKYKLLAVLEEKGDKSGNLYLPLLSPPCAKLFATPIPPLNSVHSLSSPSPGFSVGFSVFGLNTHSEAMSQKTDNVPPFPSTMNTMKRPPDAAVRGAE